MQATVLDAKNAGAKGSLSSSATNTQGLLAIV